MRTTLSLLLCALAALGHVLPRVPTHDLVHAGSVDSVGLAQRTDSAVTVRASGAKGGVFLTDGSHFGFGQFRERHLLPAVSAPLSVAITVVLPLRAEKQVVGPNASAIVATVTDAQVFRLRTVFKSPSDSVCAEVLRADADHTVPVFEHRTSPVPAGRSAIRFRVHALTNDFGRIPRTLSRHYMNFVV